MSDYVRKKAIRTIINKNIISQLGFKNVEDLFNKFEDFVREKCPDLSNYKKDESGKWKLDRKRPLFEFNSGCKENYTIEHYIDLEIYSAYGEGYNNWGIASMLTNAEYEFFAPFFYKLGLNLTINDFRKVDYCYYNGCDPDACYEVDTEDWVSKFGSIFENIK